MGFNRASIKIEHSLCVCVCVCEGGGGVSKCDVFARLCCAFSPLCAGGGVPVNNNELSMKHCFVSLQLTSTEEEESYYLGQANLEQNLGPAKENIS